METKTFIFLSTFYPPYHIGGDAIHTYQLSNELSKIGHEVHIIHLLDSYLIKRKNPRNGVYCNNDGMSIHAIKSPYGVFSLLNAYILGKSFYIDKQVENIINTVEPDVLHHQNIAGFGPSVFRYSAPKTLYTAHDYWAVCPLGTLTKPCGEFCSKKSKCFYCLTNANRPLQLWRYFPHATEYLSRIDTIISPSDFLKNILENNGLKGIVSLSNFVPIQNEVKPIYSFNYFLFVGSLEHHKGVLKLIEIFKNIKDKISSKLLLVGTGSLEPIIREQISGNKCSDQIILLGDVSESMLQSLFANAQAVVIPSVWPENCPLVALESIANGTPIIVSDQGGLPELANKINKELIFQANDFSELENIILNFDKRKYPFCYIKKIYNQYFSLERYIKIYFSLLR